MSRPASESVVGAAKRTRTGSSCADSVERAATCARPDPAAVAAPFFSPPFSHAALAPAHSSSADKPPSARHALPPHITAAPPTAKTNPRKRARPVAAPVADSCGQVQFAQPPVFDYTPYSTRAPLPAQHIRHQRGGNGATEGRNGRRIQHISAAQSGTAAAPFPDQESPVRGYRAGTNAATHGGDRGAYREEAPEKRPRAGLGFGGGGSSHHALPFEDDAEGHLVYVPGQGLHENSEFPNGRYKILSDLGEGTFGKVVECWDRQKFQRVAIKVVRNVNKYREAARLEIDVLVHLNTHDPHGYYHCVKLRSWFDYLGHVCMVFEILGPSLYEQLRRNRFQPFPLEQVRAFAYQLLESVNFVHNLTLIHTDLKPENILLLGAKQSNAIKLIDFGSATFEKQHHSAVISTRHYRAPEVILGLGWTYPCDLWSIGCILVELYTGQALFQTHENLEHLAMMSCVLGPIPDSMIRRADRSCQKYFSRRAGGRRSLNWPGGATSPASIHSVRKVRSLRDIIRCPESHKNFFDLVRRLLSFEPDTRCTSAEALRHPFFREGPQETDPSLKTPTISSGSSACGTLGGSVLRGRYRGASRRRSGTEKGNGVHGTTRQLRRPRRFEGEAEDTVAGIRTATEHNNHSLVVTSMSPRRRL